MNSIAYPVIEKMKRNLMRELMMKVKWGLGVFIVLLSAADARAQQHPMYSQYMFNMLNINPAYAGSRGVITATALYRNQWVGIDGAPQTTSVGFDMPVKEKDRPRFSVIR